MEAETTVETGSATRRLRVAPLFVLALLCLIAYAPSLTIPLIEDDYPNLAQAQMYGSPEGLATLMHTALFRLRATSYWTMYLLWQTFHLTPAAYHVASLALHIIATWLLYWAGRLWLSPMRFAAFGAAAFFAVHEGHQEAVMWFSAINELFQFVFGFGALVCWTIAARRPRGWPWQAAGVLLFALALLSKESAVILLPLFLLTAPRSDWRRSILRLAPYAALAALAVASVAATRSYSFRFSDGSFSLAAPFWVTWPRSFARLLWIWGWIASAAVFFYSTDARLRKYALLALGWIGVALLPYSFLTYSTQIPSRQIYLASAGLAFLFGVALAGVARRKSKLTAALLAAMLIHNIGYLWTKKRPQFIERAEPTDQLISLSRRTAGPIWVRCFPRVGLIAEEAVHLGAGRPVSSLVWSESEAKERGAAAVFCYSKQ